VLSFLLLAIGDRPATFVTERITSHVLSPLLSNAGACEQVHLARLGLRHRPDALLLRGLLVRDAECAFWALGRDKAREETHWRAPVWLRHMPTAVCSQGTPQAARQPAHVGNGSC
jgi:hypothetical protein